jgi:hypothetical protein
MSLGRKSLLLLLGLTASISTAPALDKDKKFTPPPLSSINGKVTNEGVTVAAIPYTTDEQAKPAFGKLNPYEHGVLPVLMVIQNNTQKAIKLDQMKVEYIDRSRERIENTPAAEVPYVKGPPKPRVGPGPIPGINIKKKNPLAAEEIETRSWAAKMLPPGESAHGFVYFRTGHRPGAKLYVTGMQEAGSAKELFYFEVPLD